jgi:hypothetical protein
MRWLLAHACSVAGSSRSPSRTRSDVGCMLFGLPPSAPRLAVRVHCGGAAAVHGSKLQNSWQLHAPWVAALVMLVAGLLHNALA